MPQLEDNVALVTGAGGGIGEATSFSLHGLGAAVAVVDLDGDAASAVARRIVDDGGRALPFAVDLADTERVRSLVDDVVAAFGRLDILVNNAGVTGGGSLLDLSEEAWTRSVAVNLTAPFVLMQAFGRHVAARGSGGKVVNLLTSGLYRAMGASGPDYVATKGGLLGLTRAGAGNLAHLDVNVNAVAPGLTDTPRIRAAGSSDEEHAALVACLASTGPTANVFGRASTADDVAEVIVFLCTPAARQVTGQVVHTSAGAVV